MLKPYYDNIKSDVAEGIVYTDNEILKLLRVVSPLTFAEAVIGMPLSDYIMVYYLLPNGPIRRGRGISDQLDFIQDQWDAIWTTGSNRAADDCQRIGVRKVIQSISSAYICRR